MRKVYFKWLYPGMGVKRWLGLSLIGSVLIIFGIGIIYPVFFQSFAHAANSLLSEKLGRIPNWLAGALFLAAGFTAAGYGLWKAFSSVVGALSLRSSGSVVELLYAKRYLQRGPKIVVIGGGTGLSTLLKGIKEYTSNITAIVTVTDDGGSSGRLRGDLGILPPGDIRNCLVALADKESLMERVLQYRFREGEMAGHNLGNLFLAALSDMSGGFYTGIQELSKVLAVRGRVLPATLQNVCVGAKLSDGTTVLGECSVSSSDQKIKHIFLEPAECQPLPEALKALQEADGIILGPGSLYTSVLPNLLVNGIPEAIKKSKAVKIYVCNVMTQPGETKNYTAGQHLKAIINHAGLIVDYAVVNTGAIPERLISRYRQEGAAPVEADVKKIARLGVKPVAENFVLESDVVRHHPEKLARAVLELIISAKTPAERMNFMKEYLEN